MINWTYCVVGNIKNTHFDDNGTLRYGTSAFTGGTKVYLSGRLWDRDRDNINALGLSRGKELQVIWTDVSHIENVRCQKVFNPAILEIMNTHEFRAGWQRGLDRAEPLFSFPTGNENANEVLLRCPVCALPLQWLSYTQTELLAHVHQIKERIPNRVSALNCFSKITCTARTVPGPGPQSSHRRMR